MYCQNSQLNYKTCFILKGKEYETRLRELKPGELTDDLRTSLGMPLGNNATKVPPPWLIAMQRYGPPPSYPNLKIPGLNAPIPSGCSFGYHAGGWGKPPVDERGRPLYGDVFGVEVPVNPYEDEKPSEQLWGEIDSDEVNFFQICQNLINVSISIISSFELTESNYLWYFCVKKDSH